MFGSEILEVAIGMGALYLVLSLVCSAITEAVARAFAMRSSTLRSGIRNLLSDPEGKGLARVFYDHPLVKGLYRRGWFDSKVGRDGKPSYVSQHVFRLALLDSLPPADSAPEDDALSKLRARVTEVDDEGLKRALLVCLDDADNAEQAQANVERWYREAMERVTGWYRRKMQLIILAVAALISVALNVDSFDVANSLWNDAALRDSVVAAAQKDTGQALSGDLDVIEERLGNLSLPLGWRSSPGSVMAWCSKIAGLLFTTIALSLGRRSGSTSSAGSWGSGPQGKNRTCRPPPERKLSRTTPRPVYLERPTLHSNDLLPPLGPAPPHGLGKWEHQGEGTPRVLEAGLAPSSVRYIHAVLHRALKQALRWGLVPRNASESVDLPRLGNEEVEVLLPEEVRAFLDASREDRLEALYVVAITVGLRRGELLGLRWTDVELDGEPKLRVGRQLQRMRDGSGRRFVAPKGGKGRTVRLPARTVEALKAHRARQAEAKLKAGPLYRDGGLVFASEIGTPLEPSNIDRRSFKPLLEKAGLPNIRFHDLRHTCATVLLSQGVNPKFVQELLGHADIKLTLGTYSHFLPSMGDQTANAMENALG